MKERMKDSMENTSAPGAEVPFVEIPDIRNLSLDHPKLAQAAIERNCLEIDTQFKANHNLNSLSDLSSIQISREAKLGTKSLSRDVAPFIENLEKGKIDSLPQDPDLISAALVTEAAKYGLIYNTAPALKEKEKKFIQGAIENLQGAALWVRDRAKETGNSVSRGKGKVAFRLGSSLAILSTFLSACGNIATPTSGVEIPTTNIAPSVEVTEIPIETATITPTQTETAMPTVTETAIPTEVPRFSELLPATLEECKKNNYLRREFLTEDLRLLSAKEDENLPTEEEIGKEVMWYYPLWKKFAPKSSNEYYYKPIAGGFKDWTAPIVSCSYLETEEKNGGLIILGFPFYSDFDNGTHVIHIAFDMGKYPEIWNYLEGKERNFNDVYNRFISHDYQTYNLMITGGSAWNLVTKWEFSNNIFKNLYEIMPYENTFLWGKAVNTGSTSTELLDQLKEKIVPGLGIDFK
jgi:hypothetical protein